MALPWGQMKDLSATDITDIQAIIAAGTLKVFSPNLNVCCWRDINYGRYNDYISPITGLGERAISNGGDYAFTITGTRNLKCVMRDYSLSSTIKIAINAGSEKDLPLLIYPISTVAGNKMIIDLDNLNPNRLYTVHIIMNDGSYGTTSYFDTILADPTAMIIPAQCFSYIYQYDKEVPKKSFGYKFLQNASGWDRKFGGFLNMITYYTGWEKFSFSEIDYNGSIDSSIATDKSVSKSVKTLGKDGASIKFSVKGSRRAIILGYANVSDTHSYNSKIYVDGVYLADANFKLCVGGNYTADTNTTAYPELGILEDIWFDDTEEHCIEIVKEAGYYGNIDGVLLEKGGTLTKFIPKLKNRYIDSFIIEKDNIFYTKRKISKVIPVIEDNKYKYRINKTDLDNNSLEFIGTKDINIIAGTNKLKYKDASHISKKELNDYNAITEMNLYTYTNKDTYHAATLKTMIAMADASAYLKSLKEITLADFNASNNFIDNSGGGAMRFSNKGFGSPNFHQYAANREYQRYSFKTTSNFISIWGMLNPYRILVYTPYHYLWEAGSHQFLVYVNGVLKATSDMRFNKDTTLVQQRVAELIRIDGITPEDVIDVVIFNVYNSGYSAYSGNFYVKFMGIGVDINATYTPYPYREKNYQLEASTELNEKSLTDISNSLVEQYIRDIMSKDNSLEYVDIYSDNEIEGLHLRGNIDGMYENLVIPERDLVIRNGFTLNNIESLNISGTDISSYKLYTIYEVNPDRFNFYGYNMEKEYHFKDINLPKNVTDELIKEIQNGELSEVSKRTNEATVGNFKVARYKVNSSKYGIKNIK